MKKNNFNSIKNIIYFLVIALIGFSSCSKEEENNDAEIINQEIYNLFKEVYFWYKQLPLNADPGSYNDPQNFIDAIKYDELDEFSAVMPQTEFEQYFSEGQSFGHGFLPGVDANLNIRVAFVYENTQMYQAGVRRSWIIKEINGSEVNTSNVFNLLGPSDQQITNDFVFEAPDGTEKEISLTKEVIELNTVIHNEIIEKEGLKIGYIVFQDFVSTAIEEIDSVFGYFLDNNIDELVLDLRYNGGGTNVVAEHITDWILGQQHAGEPFYSLRYNDKLQQLLDTTANIEVLDKGFSLDRVVFITTRNTASASEMLLNGFKPYLTVKSVGSRTRGKPVGQNVFFLEEYNYAVLPITFKYVNANNVGDFFNGIPADIPANDDLSKMFGNPEETSLQAAINYLITGSMAVPKRAPVETRAIIPDQGKGIHQFLRTY